MRRHLSIFLLVCNFCACQPGDDKTVNTLNGHPISFYLTHAEIPQFCKDLFIGDSRPTDEAEILSLFDSVFTSNDQTRPFYLLTITQTIDQADGAYAEPLGVMAKTFSETRTEDFVDFFYSNQRLPDSYFDQWVKMIAGEIQIAYENKEAQELWKLENRMKNNCAHCNEEQIEIVKKFANKIRKHFP